MRPSVLVLFTACVASSERDPCDACTAPREHDAGPPCETVAPGDFDLSVIPLLDSTINIGPRLEMDRAGTAVGHAAGRHDSPRCEGLLLPDESVELAEVLNRERALCLGDTTVDDSSDPERFDVRIRVYDASGAVQRCQAFRHSSTVSETPFHDVITVLYRITNRMNDDGVCVGPPYEYAPWPGGPSPPPPGVDCP